MYLRQFYDSSLAQASYLIGCQMTGDAIVVDPIRDVDAYLAAAASEGLRISHVTETHIHADFVSGSRELAARTGATLHLSAEGGADWQYAFANADNARLLHDGDRIEVGNIHLDVMHTPGHTPEHLAFIVTDTPRGVGPMGILSGDFVFVGDVGRPDLLEKAAHIAGTMEASARALFHSLKRFRALPDHLQLWPGHGAGSACGKALGAVPSSTVGYEKLSNWGVAETDEATFVRGVLDGQPEPPKYFAEMKRINREGPTVLGAMPSPSERPAREIVSLSRANAWVLDLRDMNRFAEGHVPGSISLPLSRSFSTWAGWIVPYDVDITLLIPQDGADGRHGADVARQAARELAMIGLDRVRGWIDADAALTAWSATGQRPHTIPQVSAEAVAKGMKEGTLHVIDVRGHTEWEAGHLPGAANIPVGLLTDALESLPSAPLVVHCQGGTRSAIAASLLHRLGRTDVRNLVGGYQGWTSARLPIEH